MLCYNSSGIRCTARQSHKSRQICDIETANGPQVPKERSTHRARNPTRVFRATIASPSSMASAVAIGLSATADDLQRRHCIAKATLLQSSIVGSFMQIDMQMRRRSWGNGAQGVVYPPYSVSRTRDTA